MQNGFGRSEFEPAEAARDRELTLGPISLATLGVLLCALCAGCFFWGYSLGHRNPVEPGSAPASALAPASPSAAQLFAQPKPTASPANAPQKASAQAVAAASNEPSTRVNPTAGASAPADDPAPAPQKSPATSASLVQAALPTQPGAAQSAAASGQVQPALGSTTAWMVQIAAVSHQEDADVLTGALRKRGYVVSVRHDPIDNLMHVQVGPFATHSDAASMRQRLLNDGYNAIIFP